jgi:hypothetical protein
MECDAVDLCPRDHTAPAPPRRIGSRSLLRVAMDIRESSLAFLVVWSLIGRQVIVQMTPAAVQHTGWKIYLLFIIMTALSIPFVYFFLPEVSRLVTLGRSWLGS